MSLREKIPASDRWKPLGGATLPMKSDSTPSVSGWTNGKLVAISSLSMAELPDGSQKTGPQWHVSISKIPMLRPSDEECRRALRAFCMLGAEEDNHHPGVARQFWMPVDPASRVDCECKDAEDVIIEPDGYKWTNPKPGTEPCRGCEYSKTFGKPCPVHAAQARTT